ncbi:MAG: hypothetical protein M3389_00105, partial [Actinomycetota bacterium]|nr:hypothetical protein [Actinomycetota bacterium]
RRPERETGPGGLTRPLRGAQAATVVGAMLVVPGVFIADEEVGSVWEVAKVSALISIAAAVALAGIAVATLVRSRLVLPLARFALGAFALGTAGWIYLPYYNGAGAWLLAAGGLAMYASAAYALWTRRPRASVRRPGRALAVVLIVPPLAAIGLTFPASIVFEHLSWKDWWEFAAEVDRMRFLPVVLGAATALLGGLLAWRPSLPALAALITVAGVAFGYLLAVLLSMEQHQSLPLSWVLLPVCFAVSFGAALLVARGDPA